MKNHTLGTVLPTAKSLAVNDRHHRGAVHRSANIAAASPDLKDAIRRTVGGEVRYYLNETTYATVPHGLFQVLFFEIRDDGDYWVATKPVKSP